MDLKTALALQKFTSQFISEERQAKFDDVIKERTRHITVVLEDIFQSRNASAVIRSCDCFGIQDAHIIENENKYEVNPLVVKGASKWVDIKKYNRYDNNTTDCIDQLKDQGYRILATSPHANDKNLDEIDVTTGKIALVFGSEKPGISDIVRERADEFVKIPMVGFSESFNISVCAAIFLNQLTNELRKSKVNYKLSSEDQEIVKAKWMLKSVPYLDKMTKEFYRRYNAGEL